MPSNPSSIRPDPIHFTTYDGTVQATPHAQDLWSAEYRDFSYFWFMLAPNCNPPLSLLTLALRIGRNCLGLVVDLSGPAAFISPNALERAVAFVCHWRSSCSSFQISERQESKPSTLSCAKKEEGRKAWPQSYFPKQDAHCR